MKQFDDLPNSAKVAKEGGEKFYFTGKPCKYGHIDKRYTSSSDCVICRSIKSKEYAESNADAIKSYIRDYQDKNKDRLSAYYKQRAEKKKDHIKKVRRSYYNNNKDDISKDNRERRLKKIQTDPNYREVLRERTRQYNRNNPDAARRRLANSRAKRAERTLEFSDPHYSKINEDGIKGIYKEAVNLTRLEGVEYEVDHIIPLRGDSVSGLHVWYNLQLLPKVDNIKKSNILLDEYVFEYFGEQHDRY